MYVRPKLTFVSFFYVFFLNLSLTRIYKAGQRKTLVFKLYKYTGCTIIYKTIKDGGISP